MNKTKYPIYIFLFTFLLLNINLILGITTAKNNVKNYFRLHVVSNSDSINDQMLKLKVTDAINNYIQNITANINDKDKYILAIKENIQNILNIAQSTLVSNNSSYNVTAQLGNIKYEEKSFNKNTMKAGTYPSLKIVIGEGKGENWWSLLYPSLPDNLTVEEALENGEIKFEFKTLDVFNHFINFLNDNNIMK